MEYRYFISFVCRQGEDGYRYGNMDFSTTKPIAGYDDVKRIQGVLAGKGGWHSVIVLFWRQYECRCDELGGLVDG